MNNKQSSLEYNSIENKLFSLHSRNSETDYKEFNNQIKVSFFSVKLLCIVWKFWPNAINWNQLKFYIWMIKTWNYVNGFII